MDDSKLTIVIWPNGKKVDSAFKVSISSSVDTLRKLKEIVMYEKDISKSFFDKIKFYNHKGIEIDDSDDQIENLLRKKYTVDDSDYEYPTKEEYMNDFDFDVF